MRKEVTKTNEKVTETNEVVHSTINNFFHQSFQNSRSQPYRPIDLGDPIVNVIVEYTSHSSTKTTNKNDRASKNYFSFKNLLNHQF